MVLAVLSNTFFRCVPAQSLSCVQLFVTPRTLACQAPLSMGCPRQENWSGLPFSSPEDLPHPGIESVSPALAGTVFITELPKKLIKHLGALFNVQLSVCVCVCVCVCVPLWLISSCMQWSLKNHVCCLLNIDNDSQHMMVFKSNSCICFHAFISWKSSLFTQVLCFQRLKDMKRKQNGVNKL